MTTEDTTTDPRPIGGATFTRDASGKWAATEEWGDVGDTPAEAVAARLNTPEDRAAIRERLLAGRRAAKV